MITKADKKRIKKVLGWRYAPVIKQYMGVKELSNSKGKPYSTQMITNVMNGVTNEIIEAAIFKLVAEKQNLIKERKQLLKLNN